MTHRTCPICGRDFLPRSASHKYCTAGCKGAVKTLQNRAAAERAASGNAVPMNAQRACAVCGEMFEPRGWRQSICLSLACVRERNRLAKIKERLGAEDVQCAVCGQLFSRASSSSRVTCSRACRDELSSQTQRGAASVVPALRQKKDAFTEPANTFCSEHPSWDCPAMDPLTNRMEPGIWVDVPDATPAIRRTAA